jgi:hypothetical protein
MRLWLICVVAALLRPPSRGAASWQAVSATLPNFPQTPDWNLYSTTAAVVNGSLLAIFAGGYAEVGAQPLPTVAAVNLTMQRTGIVSSATAFKMPTLPYATTQAGINVIGSSLIISGGFDGQDAPQTTVWSAPLTQPIGTSAREDWKKLAVLTTPGIAVHTTQMIDPAGTPVLLALAITTSGQPPRLELLRVGKTTNSQPIGNLLPWNDPTSLQAIKYKEHLWTPQWNQWLVTVVGGGVHNVSTTSGGFPLWINCIVGVATLSNMQDGSGDSIKDWRPCDCNGPGCLSWPGTTRLPPMDLIMTVRGAAVCGYGAQVQLVTSMFAEYQLYLPEDVPFPLSSGYSDPITGEMVWKILNSNFNRSVSADGGSDAFLVWPDVEGGQFCVAMLGPGKSLQQRDSLRNSPTVDLQVECFECSLVLPPSPSPAPSTSPAHSPSSSPLPSPDSSASTSPASSPTPHNDEPNNLGEILGVVAGVVVLLSGIAWACLCRKRPAPQDEESGPSVSRRRDGYSRTNTDEEGGKGEENVEARKLMSSRSSSDTSVLTKQRLNTTSDDKSD